MAIPAQIKIQNKNLPNTPGVYVMKGARGKILYIGKATSLKNRVASYFTRPSPARIAEMVRRIRRIDYERTGTAIEALILEANLIKKHQPPYNVLERDDKSFLYVVITKDQYPRLLFVRGHELEREGERAYKVVFGPYTSAASLKASLELIRKIFPWSSCEPPVPSPRDTDRNSADKNRSEPRDGAGKQKRPCFNYHLRRCPGVCIGAISRRSYGAIIKNVILFLEGKRGGIMRRLEREMKRTAGREDFEQAAKLRNQLRALEHIQDIAIIKRDFYEEPHAEESVNIFGRIEGYDISNIGGAQAVGSMVVFENGEPKKSDYRKFRIKTVRGSNDVAMLTEVLRRRFGNTDWPKPDIMLIDGGKGQVNAARLVLAEAGVKIPVIGIAKGPDRKKDEFIYERGNWELARITELYSYILKHVRDESHRFAIRYHRRVRGREFLD